MRSAQTSIEKRLATLEMNVADLRASSLKPWWESIAGSFAGDPAFAQAMKLGADYRKSTHPRSGAKRHVHP